MRRPGPESRLAIFGFIAPLLESTITGPIPPEVVATIRRDAVDHRQSLPITLALRIYQEGLKMQANFERIFQLPKGYLGGNDTLVSFPILYSMAPGHIRDVEAYLKSTSAVEEAAQQAARRLPLTTQEPHLSTYVADLTLAFNTLTGLMRTDPTGFQLVDRIAYGTPIPNSPMTVIHQYPPLVKIIQVGAERYKSLYRAVSKQSKS